MFNWENKFGYISRYLTSGVLNTVVGFAVIFFLMMLGISPVTSNIVGYMVGIMLGFTLSRGFVFKSNGSIIGEGWRYIVCFAISFVINLFVLIYALESLHLSKEISQIFAAATYTLLMYIFSYYLIFVSRS